jgi:hypothetical protein
MGETAPETPMSKEKIQDLLQQLRGELGSTPLDPETRSMLRELDATLHAHTGAADSPLQSLGDRVRDLEARFAAKHEGAEKILRQVIDVLGNMGV